MNLLLWGSEIDDKLFPVLEEIKKIGFDTVEIPIFDTNIENWANWPDKLNSLNFNPIGVTINGGDQNFISPDKEVRDKTLERNKKAVEIASFLGCKILGGPFHSALGYFTGKKRTEQEWNWAVENLQALADFAKSKNVILGLEYLNRFESFLVSSSDELLQLVESVNHPNCKIMFDTFHANIEENNISESLVAIKNYLVHVQLSENHRGILGTGHVDFEAILKTLNEINYSGSISIEAFSEKLSVAHIWRKLFINETELMIESYNYLKSIK